MLSRTLQSSAVQTDVNACGKKSNKTFLPLNSCRLTLVFSELNKLKSGAVCPTLIMLMNLPYNK
jgi:hypothetical protein